MVSSMSLKSATEKSVCDLGMEKSRVVSCVQEVVAKPNADDGR